MNTLKLEVVTPERKVFDEEVNLVIAKGSDGELGILPNHIPLVTPLRVAPLRYKQGEATHTIAVHGGFVEIRGDKVVVLAEAAEFPDQIDLARAENAKQRAEDRINANDDHTDTLRAEMALKRALNRIEVANIK